VSGVRSGRQGKPKSAKRILLCPLRPPSRCRLCWCPEHSSKGFRALGAALVISAPEALRVVQPREMLPPGGEGESSRLSALREMDYKTASRNTSFEPRPGLINFTVRRLFEALRRRTAKERLETRRREETKAAAATQMAGAMVTDSTASDGRQGQCRDDEAARRADTGARNWPVRFSNCTRLIRVLSTIRRMSPALLKSSLAGPSCRAPPIPCMAACSCFTRACTSPDRRE
jgi:hypothetical protein